MHIITYGLRVHTCIYICSYDYVSDPTEHRSRIYVYIGVTIIHMYAV